MAHAKHDVQAEVVRILYAMRRPQQFRVTPHALGASGSRTGGLRRSGRSIDLQVAEIDTHSIDAARAMANATAEMRHNDLPAAYRSWERAIAADSTVAFAYAQASVIAQALGRPEEGAAHVRMALRYGYRLPERARLNIQVDLASAANDVETAVRTARFWAEVYPDDIDARAAQPRAYLAAGDREAALEQLRVQVSLDTTDVEVLDRLGVTFYGLDRPDSAIAYWRKVLDRQPDNEVALLNLPVALEDLGRIEEARAQLEVARAQLEVAKVALPTSPRPWIWLARRDLDAGDLDAARTGIEEARLRERADAERISRAEIENTLYYRTGQFVRFGSVVPRAGVPTSRRGMDAGPDRRGEHQQLPVERGRRWQGTTRRWPRSSG